MTVRPEPAKRPVLPPPLTRGDRGYEVRELQANLAALGWLIIETGVYDHATEKTVAEFQKAFGMTVSGEATAETRSAISTYLACNRTEH